MPQDRPFALPSSTPPQSSISTMPRRESRAARLSNMDALSIWHRVNLDHVLGDQPDLSARQMAVLSTVYLDGGPHTVRSLAANLNVTKAVITRALDRLSRDGLVERGPDVRDKRSVIIMRTARGTHYLTRFAETIRREIKLGQINIAAA